MITTFQGILIGLGVLWIIHITFLLWDMHDSTNRILELERDNNDRLKLIQSLLAKDSK